MLASKVPFRLSRLDGGIALCTAAIAFALYARTLYPGMLPGDSGEFQALAALLAHTHPTGYDVYLLLAKIFTLIPVQSIAYRVNLFSAFMAGLTVGCIYLAGTLLSGKRWAGFFGATALAISSTFWSQAVIAEVYTAGSFFFALLVLLILLWDQDKKGLYLAAAAALGVLSLGVHLTVALGAPAVAIYLLLSWKDWKQMWKPVTAGLLVGAVLFAGIFLLVDRNQGPESYFSTTVRPGLSLWEMSPSDVDSPWERLVWQYRVPQFRQFMFQDIDTVMPRQARLYWKALPDEFAWLTIGLGILGIAATLLRRWRIGVLLIFALVGQYFYTFNYPIWDFYVFYLPSYGLVALCAAAGAGFLFSLLDHLPESASDILQPALGLVLVTLSLWPFLPAREEMIRAGEPDFPYDQYPVNWVDEGYHTYISKIAAALDENAILFTDWGKLFPLIYAAQVEQGRDDLQFMETYPQDEALGLSQSELDLIRQNLADHPIYFDTNPKGLTKAGFRTKLVWRGPINLYQVQK
jgi:hypothetical protein